MDQKNLKNDVFASRKKKRLIHLLQILSFMKFTSIKQKHKYQVTRSFLSSTTDHYNVCITTFFVPFFFIPVNIFCSTIVFQTALHVSRKLFAFYFTPKTKFDLNCLPRQKYYLVFYCITASLILSRPSMNFHWNY